jgi:hypothetical protein
MNAGHTPSVDVPYTKALPHAPQNFAEASRTCPHSVQKDSAGLIGGEVGRVAGGTDAPSGYLRLIRQRPSSQVPNRTITSAGVIIPKIAGEYPSDKPTTYARPMTKTMDPNKILSRLLGGVPPLRRYLKSSTAPATDNTRIARGRGLNGGVWEIIDHPSRRGTIHHSGASRNLYRATK